MVRALIFLSVLLYSCNKEADISDLSAFINGTIFEIEAVYYGGIVGEQSVTYEFSETNDSVRVRAFSGRPWPRQEVEKLMISVEQFAEVKESLRCISQFHLEGKPSRSGCMSPWDTEYFIAQGFKRIRIFPSRTDTCSIEEIIYSSKRLSR